MSLKKFVKWRTVKPLISKYFEIPKVNLGDIKMPVIANNPKLVGSAYDYLLRFMIARANQNKLVERSWVAENALAYFKDDSPRLYKKMKTYVDYARKHFNRYLATGELTDNLIKLSLHLALIDAVYRSQNTDIDITTVDEKDIEDLRKLISITDVNLFKAKNVCYLNPTFGIGSYLVGGADADLIVDDTIIDFKTVQSGRILPDDILQLIGYYFLTRIGSINGRGKKAEIANLGIYSSRHATLHTFSIKSMAKTDDLAEFLTLLTEIALGMKLGNYAVDNELLSRKFQKETSFDYTESSEMYRERMEDRFASEEKMTKSIGLNPYPMRFNRSYCNLVLKNPRSTYEDYLPLIEKMYAYRTKS